MSPTSPASTAHDPQPEPHGTASRRAGRPDAAHRTQGHLPTRRPPRADVHASVRPKVDQLHQAHVAAAGPALDLAHVLRRLVDDGRGAFVGNGGWVENLAVDRLEAVVHAAQHGYLLCPHPGAHGARCWSPAQHPGDCLFDHGWLWSLAYGRRHKPAVEVYLTCTPGRRTPAPEHCPHRIPPT